MGILNLFKKPQYIFIWLGLSVLAFDGFFILMKELPGEANNMCVPGANLTPFNIAFAVVFSLLVMLLLVGTIYFMRHSTRKSALLISTSFLGAFLGFFTLFCSFCVLPLAGIVGVSLVLSFFTANSFIFKVISLVLLGYGLWLLDRKLRISCDC